MALGLARMFGIRLPINFNSPYKSLSISEFWRRWHITLSRFLRDYLYIPLGGNRSGWLGTLGNLMVTMLLGGLWHGAGWNFVIWGGLHGGFLIVNHLWRDFAPATALKTLVPASIRMMASWSLTMLCVVVAWVFFRATSFNGALVMINSMFGLSETLTVEQIQLVSDPAFATMMIASLIIVVTALPNSIEITSRYRPVIETAKELSLSSWRKPALTWRPASAWGLCMAVAGSVALIQLYRLNEMTEFIYFNF